MKLIPYILAGFSMIFMLLTVGFGYAGIWLGDNEVQKRCQDSAGVSAIITVALVIATIITGEISKHGTTRLSRL